MKSYLTSREKKLAKRVVRQAREMQKLFIKRGFGVSEEWVKAADDLEACTI